MTILKIRITQEIKTGSFDSKVLEQVYKDFFETLKEKDGLFPIKNPDGTTEQPSLLEIKAEMVVIKFARELRQARFGECYLCNDHKTLPVSIQFRDNKKSHWELCCGECTTKEIEKRLFQ